MYMNVTSCRMFLLLMPKCSNEKCENIVIHAHRTTREALAFVCCWWESLSINPSMRSFLLPGSSVVRLFNRYWVRSLVWAGPFCVEFASSPCVSVGSLHQNMFIRECIWRRNLYQTIMWLPEMGATKRRRRRRSPSSKVYILSAIFFFCFSIGEKLWTVDIFA